MYKRQEGIYGGWGNFGSAFSALTMVALAGFLSFSSGFELPTGAVLNWRGAIALTGIVSAVYGLFYFCNVTDTPPARRISARRNPPAWKSLPCATSGVCWA